MSSFTTNKFMPALDVWIKKGTETSAPDFAQEAHHKLMSTMMELVKGAKAINSALANQHGYTFEKIFSPWHR